MTEKSAFWTKETKIALVILFLFSGLMAFLIFGDTVSSDLTPYVSAANSGESTAFAEEPVEDPDVYDAEYVSSGASSAPKSAHSNPGVAMVSESSEPVTVRWLIMELRRLIRAGRSMEGLRNSDNATLTRRCLDGMKKLQKQSRSVMARGGSLQLPGDQPSINAVLSNIKVCTSCGGTARQSCNAADRDLTLIAQGLPK